MSQKDLKRPIKLLETVIQVILEFSDFIFVTVDCVEKAMMRAFRKLQTFLRKLHLIFEISGNKENGNECKLYNSPAKENLKVTTNIF